MELSLIFGTFGVGTSFGWPYHFSRCKTPHTKSAHGGQRCVMKETNAQQSKNTKTMLCDVFRELHPSMTGSAATCCSDSDSQVNDASLGGRCCARAGRRLHPAAAAASSCRRCCWMRLHIVCKWPPSEHRPVFDRRDRRQVGCRLARTRCLCVANLEDGTHGPYSIHIRDLLVALLPSGLGSRTLPGTRRHVLRNRACARPQHAARRRRQLRLLHRRQLLLSHKRLPRRRNRRQHHGGARRHPRRRHWPRRMRPAAADAWRAGHHPRAHPGWKHPPGERFRDLARCDRRSKLRDGGHVR
mmetsp:Transcript_721/g.1963  ORF Transcript_721/g.1963 Transcript_721/m.1963 type:complete len:299 (+) Transcript_721:452-1348(+)